LFLWTELVRGLIYLLPGALSHFVTPLVNNMEEDILQWFDHVMRRDETEAVRMVMKIDVEGKRGKGRPKNRWLDSI